MTRRTRRSYLAALAGVAAGASGCLDEPDVSGTPTDPGQPAGTDAPTDAPGSAATATPSPSRLVLEAVPDVEGAAAEAPLTVYPGTLRHWLLRAANTGGTVRGHDEARVYSPDPVVPRFETVRLTGSGVDGTYDLTAEAGARYELLVGADPVDPPADAAVTPVEELPADRREFARAAIDPGERATVYPETVLGEWVRQDFFGGYFEDGDGTYRGTEVQQTDAAFFSTTAWYVLGTSPTDGPADATLRLAELPPAATEVVDEALSDFGGGSGRVTYEGNVPPEAVELAAGGTYLLTHTAVVTVEVER